MTVLLQDDLESGYASKWSGSETSGGTVAVASSVVRNGSYSIEATTQSSGSYGRYEKNLGGNYADVYVAAWVQVDRLPDGDGENVRPFVVTKSDEGTKAYAIIHNSGGTVYWGIRWYDSGSGWTNTLSSVEVVAGQWYYIVFRVHSDNSAGITTLWVDGKVGAHEEDALLDGTNLVAYVKVGSCYNTGDQSAATTIYVDDVIIATTIDDIPMPFVFVQNDSFETADLSKWTGSFSNSGIAPVGNDQTNVEHGAYNFKAGLSATVSTGWSLVYQALNSEYNPVAVREMKGVFDHLPDNNESQRIIGIGRLSSSEAVAYGGIINDGGTAKWFVFYRDGGSFSSETGTSTPAVDTEYDIELVMFRDTDNTGWIRLYINNELEIEVTGIDHARASDYAWVGYCYSDAPDASACYFKCDCAVVANQYIGSYPIFGRVNTCSSTWSTEDRIVGVKFTAPEAGLPVSVVAHLTCTTASHFTKCAIYDSSYNLVAVTEEKLVSPGANWINFDIETVYATLKNEAYYLVVWSEAGDGDIVESEESSGESGQQIYDGLAYASFPDPLAPDGNYAYRVTMYAEYLPISVVSKTITDAIMCIEAIEKTHTPVSGVVEKTITEILTITETISREVKGETSKTLTEAIAVMEALTQKSVGLRSAAITDLILGIKAGVSSLKKKIVSKSLSDFLVDADAPAKTYLVKFRAKTLQEVVAVIDAVSKIAKDVRQKEITDLITVAKSISTLNVLMKTKTVQELMLNTESEFASSVAQRVRELSETVSVLESLSAKSIKQRAIVISEAVAVFESLTAANIATRIKQLKDIILAGDDVTKTATLTRIKQLAENITFTEKLTKATVVARVRQPAENFLLTETSTATSIKQRTLTLANVLQVMSDLSLNTLQKTSRTLSDLVIAPESITIQRLAVVSEHLSEAIILTESISAISAKQRAKTLAETLTVTESLQRTLALTRQFQELITFTEIQTFSKKRVKTLANVFLISDGVQSISAKKRSRQLAETLMLSETITEVAKRIRTVNLQEKLTLTEVLQRAATQRRLLQEVVMFIESKDVRHLSVAGTLKLISETFVFVEEVKRIAQQRRLAQESILISETLNRQIVKQKRILEYLTVIESIGKTSKAGLKTLLSYILFEESAAVTKKAVRQKQLSESLIIADNLSKNVKELTIKQIANIILLTEELNKTSQELTTKELLDYITVIEDLSRTVAASKKIQEILMVTDAVKSQKVVTKAVTEAIMVYESITRKQPKLTKVLAETVTVTETMWMQYPHRIHRQIVTALLVTSYVNLAKLCVIDCTLRKKYRDAYNLIHGWSIAKCISRKRS